MFIVSALLPGYCELLPGSGMHGCFKMKVLRHILLILSSIIFITVIDQYCFCPVYSFTGATSFAGDSIYNPYALSVSGNWEKCNFHSHAHCWKGFTSGTGTASDVLRAYSKLGYNIYAVSDYQYIDTTDRSSPNYVSSYEHGYNILKSHQLVLGADAVCWKDYLLPQTLNNKQDVLNHISATAPNALLIINHPLDRNGYRSSDFMHLTRYSCMEVLNPSCNSSLLWDAALSAGKPIFIIGDDDCHNVLDTNKVGKICTWINVPEINKNNILQAIKTGSSYAMTIGKNLMQSERQGYSDSMPMLKNFTVTTDTIHVKFSLPAKDIIISGENGRLLYKVSDNDSVSFKLGKQEPYARITAVYNKGTQLLLNPVFRYKTSPLYQSTASINSTQTSLLRTAGVIAMLVWFGLILKLPLPQKTQKKLLPNISTTGYGHISNIHSKIIKVRHRRIIGHLREFFYNMDDERETKIK